MAWWADGFWVDSAWDFNKASGGGLCLSVIELWWTAFARCQLFSPTWSSSLFISVQMQIHMNWVRSAVMAVAWQRSYFLSFSHPNLCWILNFSTAAQEYRRGVRGFIKLWHLRDWPLLIMIVDISYLYLRLKVTWKAKFLRVPKLLHSLSVHWKYINLSESDEKNNSDMLPTGLCSSSDYSQYQKLWPGSQIIAYQCNTKSVGDWKISEIHPSIHPSIHPFSTA